MTSKTKATRGAPRSAGSAGESKVLDMPEEIDFAKGLRGQAGQDTLVRLARYRRALLTIRDMSGVGGDALRTALAMQEVARKALEGGGT